MGNVRASRALMVLLAWGASTSFACGRSAPNARGPVDVAPCGGAVDPPTSVTRLLVASSGARAVDAVSVSPHGLLGTISGPELRVWDPRSGVLVAALTGPRPPRRVVWSLQEDTVAFLYDHEGRIRRDGEPFDVTAADVAVGFVEKETRGGKRTYAGERSLDRPLDMATLADDEASWLALLPGGAFVTVDLRLNVHADVALDTKGVPCTRLASDPTGRRFACWSPLREAPSPRLLTWHQRAAAADAPVAWTAPAAIVDVTVVAEDRLELALADGSRVLLTARDGAGDAWSPETLPPPPGSIAAARGRRALADDGAVLSYEGGAWTRVGAVPMRGARRAWLVGDDEVLRDGGEDGAGLALYRARDGRLLRPVGEASGVARASRVTATADRHLIVWEPPARALADGRPVTDVFAPRGADWSLADGSFAVWAPSLAPPPSGFRPDPGGFDTRVDARGALWVYQSGRLEAACGERTAVVARNGGKSSTLCVPEGHVLQQVDDAGAHALFLRPGTCAAPPCTADVRVVDLQSGEDHTISSADHGPFRFDARGTRLFTADGLAYPTNGELTTWVLRPEGAAPDFRPDSVEPSSSGRYAVVRSGARSWVLGLDTGDGRAIDAPVLAVSADGRRVVEEDPRHGVRLSDGAALGRDGTRFQSVRFLDDLGVLAAVTEDGAVEVHDLATGKKRATFVAFADGESVAFTPNGAYAGSREVSRYVGWVFQRPLEGFAFDQLASTRQRPDLVRRRLAGEDVDLPFDAPRPPRVVLDPVPERVDDARVRVHAAASSDGRVDKIVGFVEGRPVAAARVCGARGDASLELPLLPGANRVSVVAFDAAGLASNPAVADVVSAAKSAERPDLYVVAVGIEHYPHVLDRIGGLSTEERAAKLESLRLGAAPNDARAVGDTLGALAGPGQKYAAAHVAVLTDAARPIHRADVVRALAPLASMRPIDVAVVLFAGHGVKVPGKEEMVFVTSDARLAPDGRAVDPECMASDAVGWDDLGPALERAPGRVLVLVDACHSGDVASLAEGPSGAVADALLRAGRSGAIVFAAAKGRQASQEADHARALTLDLVPRAATSAPVGDGDHGYFTAAFLRALTEPGTDRDGDGELEVSEIVEEVEARVARASNGEQTPWVARQEMFGDFAVARAPR